MVAAAGTEAASLTLAMRTGDDPGAVFDVLLARGQIRRHPDAAALQDAIAAAASFSDGDDRRVAVVVDTREQAAELNAALRERLVAPGRVDDIRVVVTAAGERLGAGNRITTRRKRPGPCGLFAAWGDPWPLRRTPGRRESAGQRRYGGSGDEGNRTPNPRLAKSTEGWFGRVGFD